MSYNYKPGDQITSWSFSRYETYTQCPAKAKYKFLLKLPDPGGPAMTRGTEIHSMADKFILGKTKKIPAELSSLTKEYVELRKLGTTGKVQVEQSWGFDSRWNPCSPTDWANCWLRVKLDASYMVVKANTLHVEDHKTGKIKPEPHADQLGLYGVTGLIVSPNVRAVQARLLYVDHGVTETLVVERDQLKPGIKFWNQRVAPMLKDKRFAPRPGNYCSYCPYSKSKQGPCKF